MSQGQRDGPVCGHPMKFYKLRRERTDLFPSCHRTPGHGGKHLSLAAMERQRADVRARRHMYDKKTGRKRAA